MQTISRVLEKVRDPRKIWFLTGDDALWKLREQIFTGVNVIISRRSGESLEFELPRNLEHCPPEFLRPPHLHMVFPEITDMSSTRVRKCIQDPNNLSPEALHEKLLELVGIPSVTEYLLEKKLFTEYPKIIGISGRSGIGKTTLSKALVSKISELSRNVAHMNLDDFFKPYSELTPITDNPMLEGHGFWYLDRSEAMNWDLIFAEIQKNREVGTDFIILEGAHIFCSPQLVDACDFLFFMEGPVEECKARRLARGRKKNSEEMKRWNEYWENYLLPFSEECWEVAKKNERVVFLSMFEDNLGTILEKMK
jgi:uridine kinase